MKKVEALISPESIDDVRELLDGFNVSNFAFANVLTNPGRESRQRLYRGHSYTPEFDREVKMEAVVGDYEVSEIVHALLKVIGGSGPGKRRIVLTPVSEVIFEADEFSSAPPRSDSPQAPRVGIEQRPSETIAVPHQRLWKQATALLAKICGRLIPAESRANASVPLVG